MSKPHIPYLAVILILLLVIAVNRCDTSQPKIKERIVEDTTTVDSLMTRVEYLENLPPDTIKVEVEVPAEPDTVYTDESGVSIKEYTTTHSDSLITAMWTTKTTGRLVGQDFTYMLRNRVVEQRTTTKYLTRTRTIERTITEPQGGFLAVGGEMGAGDKLSLSAILRYQAKDGYSYHYRYDTTFQSHNIGITIPIRINIPFL